MAVKRESETITVRDIAVMVSLISSLDADKYARPAARAMIYRCKDMVENPPKYVRFVDG